MKTITRYIPQNSTPIERAGLPGIVYSYKNQHGNLCAIAYAGKSGKATWHYNFKSPAMREARIDQFFNGLAQREDYKLSRKIEKATFRHTLKVGDILHSSWGYEQTNVEFYQITAVTEKTVTFREICQTCERTGHDQGTCLPVKNEWAKDSTEFTRVVKSSSDGKGSVAFADFPGGYVKNLWYTTETEAHRFSDGY